MAIDHSAVIAPATRRVTLDATANDAAVLTPPKSATSVLIMADDGSAIHVSIGNGETDGDAIGTHIAKVAAGGSLSIPLESTGAPGQHIGADIALASPASAATCCLSYGA